MAESSKHALRVDYIRLALRPLFPRVVAPLEGRSSGFRISRSDAPSQSNRTSGSMRRSSPVTATGSRRNFTGFPQVGSTLNRNEQDSAHLSPDCECAVPAPQKSIVRLIIEGTPSTVGGPLRISPALTDAQEAGQSAWRGSEDCTARICGAAFVGLRIFN